MKTPVFRVVLLIALLFTGINTEALTLSSFDARYHVYRGDIHVANSQFTLKKQQSEWVWSMNTRPRGIYSWLTRKKPFAETRLQDIEYDYQILLERTGDYPQKPASRNTWFDHTHKTLYSMNGKKISQLELPDNVYNYHSIHLLYPQMLEQNTDQITVNFYKKGKLQESTLELEQQVKLPSKKTTMIVDKVTHTFKDSNKTLIYYYQGDTFAPLKIEHIKPGKDSSVMWRVESTQ